MITFCSERLKDKGSVLLLHAHLITLDSGVPKASLNDNANKIYCLMSTKHYRLLLVMYLVQKQFCNFMNSVHSFIFSSHFILVLVVVDSEPMPGTLGAKREHILDGMPIHRKATCLHNFTHSFTPRGHLTWPDWHVLGK